MMITIKHLINTECYTLGFVSGILISLMLKLIFEL